MSYKVKTIISSNTKAQKDDVLQLPPGESPRDYDDVAFFHSHEYATIFKENRADSSDEQKLLSVVKITYKGRSIHRSYRCSAKLGKNEVGLSANSQRLLFGKLSNADEVTITKGSKFRYFWDHPCLATQMSIRIGVISIVLAVLSMLVF